MQCNDVTDKPGSQSEFHTTDTGMQIHSTKDSPSSFTMYPAEEGLGRFRYNKELCHLGKKVLAEDSKNVQDFHAAHLLISTLETSFKYIYMNVTT